MRRKAYKSKKKNPIIFFMASFVIILLCCTLFGAFLALAKGDGQNADKYYKSIQIQSGDTLWNIAEEHKTAEYDSVSEYISDLKQINNLSSDQIQSGQHLIIICDDEMSAL